MKISVVTSLYYSEKYVHEFYKRVKRSVLEISPDYEIIFVNDGSPDQALKYVLDIQQIDKNVTVIDLSRNFGHHRALMTGLRMSVGDYVFLIDSDLEEDPELVNLYWEHFQDEQEVDVVFGVQDKRKGGWKESISGRIWYRIFSALSDIDYPSDTLTARLMTKRYVESVKQYHEKELEIWGIFVLAGFNQKSVVVSKGNKGTSVYTFSRKLKMMTDSITSFSSKPLIYIFVMGVMIMFVSGLYILHLILMKLIYNEIMEGWTSILVSLWFLGGVLVFCIGIIGIYLSKMFLEVKNRPQTIIRNVYKGK